MSIQKQIYGKKDDTRPALACTPPSFKPKKRLGQHFLKDDRLAQRIVSALRNSDNYQHVLEIGPGKGALTTYLLKQPWTLHALEVDHQAVAWLHARFGQRLDLLHEDFLCFDLSQLPKPLGLIGNFPYHLSAPIFFKIIACRDQIPEVVCMVQHEVGQRLSSPSGSKTYGLLSVLLQCYYEVEYLFRVPPTAFYPRPQVYSAVLRLRRKSLYVLPCGEDLFLQVLKAAFGQRRKQLKNALKPLLTRLGVPSISLDADWAAQRAESLSAAAFVALVQQIEAQLEKMP